jgi:hypothetical protein
VQINNEIANVLKNTRNNILKEGSFEINLEEE